MGALKLTYQLNEYTPNLRVAYKSGSVNQREPTTKDGSKLRLHYCVFGMEMPGRSYQGSEPYRFGHIGAERDREWNGTGNTYNHTFRMYDARIGRYKSLDPLASSFPVSS